MLKSFHTWVVIDNLIVTFSTAGEIGDEDWDGFMNDLATKPVTKYLGSSVGSVHVDSLKRKNGSEILKRKGISSAIVTDERLVRGLVTAVSWLGVDMKAFAWSELRSAIAHLGMSAREERIVKLVMEQKQIKKAA